MADGKVLVVDDEQVVLQSCERILTPQGYEVDTSLSAPDALSMLKQKDYDLVITDMMMPDMDGLEFMRRVKAESPDMNIVLITGYPSQESLKEALQLKIVDYLPKPFSPALLLEAVQKASEIKRKAVTTPVDGDYTEEVVEKLDEILKDHKDRPGGLMPVLMAAQDLVGYLPPVVLKHISRGLNLSVSEVHGVVSFYTYFSIKPMGKRRIKVCMGTACFVKRAQEIIKRLKEVLGIDLGEVTPDRAFSMESVNCLGACGLAPVVVVNTDTFGGIDPVSAEKILEEEEE